MGAKNMNIWSIGRDADCDIVLNSKNVSRKQAEIIRHEEVYYLVNHSKHKTSYIERGGQKIRVEKKELSNGDLLYFADEGPYEMKDLIDGDMTVISLVNVQTSTPTLQTNPIEKNIKVEKKRCIACATILAKTQNKCHECGSMT